MISQNYNTILCSSGGHLNASFAHSGSSFAHSGSGGLNLSSKVFTVVVHCTFYFILCNGVLCAKFPLLSFP